MEPIMKANKNGYRLEIFQDEAPDSPRNWDNLGKMICFSSHNLGDNTATEILLSFSSPCGGNSRGCRRSRKKVQFLRLAGNSGIRRE